MSQGWCKGERSSCAEAVEGTALTFEGVDDIQGGDRLALGVLGVGDRVSNDVLEENLPSHTEGRQMESGCCL
jgi:hypothetical protein